MLFSGRFVISIICLCAILAISGCSRSSEEFSFYHSANLSPQKVQWLLDIAADIKEAKGINVSVKKVPLFFDKDVWLFVTPNDFENWRANEYATISLENEIAMWISGTLGVNWLAPEEIESGGMSVEYTPFREWLASSTRLGKKKFYMRDLRWVPHKRNQYWGTANGLHLLTGRDHAHYKYVQPWEFETHPHLFAKDPDGQPIPPAFVPPRGFNYHPDLLENEVVERFARAAINVFRQNPNLGDFPMQPNDSYEFGYIPQEHAHLRPNGYFKELKDYSNYVYDFGNRVADLVAEAFPDKYLLTGAYMNWLNVPDIELHPMHTVDIADDRAQWYDPDYKARDLDLIQRWLDTGMELVGVTDYIYGEYYLIPRSLTGVVSESIPLYYDLGIRRYRSYVYPLWGYDAHTTWLAAQLAWASS